MPNFREIKRKARSTRDETLVERLHELFSYDPETGVLSWRPRPAGTLNSEGYVQVSVDGRIIAVHRIAFAMMTGAFPPDEIDHKNKVRSDNSWGNLRTATCSQNMLNTGMLSSNTSGYKGVSKVKKTGRWVAKIEVEGKRHILGYFVNIEDAAQAYADAKFRLLGGRE